MPRKTILSLAELDDLRVDPDEVYDDRNWYRVRMDESKHSAKERSIGLEDEGRDGLPELREWDVPEHLPNSPLCPLHPKYRGKPSKTCPYHGRRRSLRVPAGPPERPRSMKKRYS